MPGLTPDTVKHIDGVLAAAAGEGRGSLYEHEVYTILSFLGLTVPRFLFLKDVSEVGESALRGFGHTVIVKIVSPDIPHKQKLGGVKKVSTADPLFVQYVLSRMREEVLSHFPAGSPPSITGFLVVEYIPHTQAIGYEVLIGFREDPAFGPVLTVSKGGDDAEFFATHYDPANLFLPPLEYQEALAFMRSLHIRYKFEQIGHPEYLSAMARAITDFSSLALHYSPMSPRPVYVIKALEVNPFAISSDNRFVALDGLAEFGPSPSREDWGPGAALENLDAFFRPRGVAVVGVSADLSKYNMARDIAELLHELRRDDLYLVNPHAGTVKLGETEYPLYASLSEVPFPVELAVYAAPAANAPDFLRSLAGSGAGATPGSVRAETAPPSGGTRTRVPGTVRAETAPGTVRAVVLIPGVPSAIPYTEYARSLRASVPPGVRVIGPNCMGVYHAAAAGRPGINTLFINEKRLEVRSSETANAVLLTQSGALSVTVIDKLRNCRPLRAIVSFGNKFDVKTGELLAYFARDPSVAVIGVYLEGLDPGEGRSFFERSRETDKPIIAYKGGRTAAGARSAASHTASMSGSYEVFRAACRQARVILADTIEDFDNQIRAFSLLAGKPPKGNRVAGVVNAGFESTVGADELKGLTQARLCKGTVEKLNAINRFGLVDTASPFLDVTPMADDAMYAEFVEAVIEDDGVDCVFVAVVPHAVSLKTVPETCRDPDGLANLLVGISRRQAKPMVVSVNAGRHYADFVAALEEGGLAVYPDIRSAITSLDTFVSSSVGRRNAGPRGNCPEA